MKHIKHGICMVALLALAAGGATPSVQAAAPAYLFGAGFESGGGQAVAVDGDNNVIVAGVFSGSIDAGGGVLSSLGTQDIFFAKFAPDGSHIWSFSVGGTGFDVVWDIAVDASGNIYATGGSSGINFGGGPLFAPSGASNAFLVKYSPGGTHLWSHGFGDVYADYGYGVAVTPAGGVVMAGVFGGSVNFGGGTLVASNGDAFVAQYDASGAHQWSRRGGGASSDQARGVAVDDTGHVIVAGYFNGTGNFGGSDLAGASFNGFLAEYDASGAHQWSFIPDGVGESVAFTADGDIYLAGQLNQDLWLARYASDGSPTWSRTTGSPFNDHINDVTAGANDGAVVTGDWRHVIMINNVNYVDAHVWIASYDAAGDEQWSGYYGTDSNDDGRSVAVDQAGNVWATGYLAGAASVGGPVLGVNGNAFLAKYGAQPASPIIASVADVPDDEGRRVHISFAASGHDQAAAPQPVVRYEVYRRNGDASAAAPPPDASARTLLDTGWVEVGSAASSGAGAYAMDADTEGDSTVAGPFPSSFFVRAATAQPATFYDSETGDGYSVDNLAPPAPANLAHAGGQLGWDASSADDFDYFTVYGGNSGSFGAATLVDYTVAPAFDVTGAPYDFYFVTATDFAGNEGSPASLNTLTGAGDAPRSYVLSLGNFPNPFNPSTTLRYTVPARGNVTVAVYDARGARVVTLVDNESRDAGAHRVDWTGRDDRGLAVPSGVYFARIEQAGVVRTRKMLLLK